MAPPTDDLHAHCPAEQFETRIKIRNNEFQRDSTGGLSLQHVSFQGGWCPTDRILPTVTAESKGASAARALFVLGAPRSGTTLVGNYLGSADGVLNLGEYGGFHLAYNIAPSTLGAMPGSYREPYPSRDLVVHAEWFAEGLAASEHKSWYCDTTPFNIRAADRMAAEMPDALFILMLRHYSGTIQSLRRSFASGFHWAGQSGSIPPTCGRTPINPWRRSRSHGPWWSVSTPVCLTRARDRKNGGMGEGARVPGRWTRPRRVRRQPRTTVEWTETDHRASGGRPGGTPAMSSFEQIRWSGDIHRAVWPVVEPVHRALQSRYPRIYGAPDPPAELWTHDDIQGLLPLVIGDNW